MSVAIEQLQQLSHDELRKLSHSYGIADSQIVKLDRRQLQRRLHVAIISERARMRAHDKFYARQYVEEETGSSDWESDSSVNDSEMNEAYHRSYNLNNRRQSLESRRSDLTAWSYFNMRRQKSRLPLVTSRTRGGLDFRNKIARCSYACDAEDFEDFDDSDGRDESDESEHLKELDDRIGHHSSDTQIENFDLSESIDAINNTIDRRSSSANTWEKGGENCQPAPKITERNTILSYLGNNKTAIQRDDLFNWINDSNFDSTQESEPDFDRSSELEICTVNFLENYQDDIKKPVSMHNDRSKDTQGAISRPNQQSQDRKRSASRQLIDWFLLNMQRKFNTNRIGYSIICCCTMVICTYIGFKIMK